MDTEPTLTARAILPLVSGLRRLGHDVDALLGAVGIDRVLLANPDARLPMRLGSGLLAHAAAASRDESIGLHVAEHADLRSVDVHFYAMRASATLRDAYERLSRYQRLIHETHRIELVYGEHQLTLRHAVPAGRAVPRHIAEFLVAAWVRTGRLVTATGWSPDDVRFAHDAPAARGEYDRFFRAPIHFCAGENAVMISSTTLALRCAGADAALASLIDRYAGEHMPAVVDAPSIADRVRSAVGATLRDGDLSATATAARLRMSVRTLNRALAAEGTTYRAVVDEVRHALARRHLADQRTSIGEVAFLLGFSETSAFHRAFKRWARETPAAYRARVRRTHAG